MPSRHSPATAGAAGCHRSPNSTTTACGATAAKPAKTGKVAAQISSVDDWKARRSSLGESCSRANSGEVSRAKASLMTARSVSTVRCARLKYPAASAPSAAPR